MQRLMNQPALVTTVDATLTTAITFPLPNNTGGVFRVLVSARKTSTNATANAAAYLGAQNIAGTAAVLGTPTFALTIANGSDASMTGVAVSFAVSGGNLLVQVTGLGATQIEWHLAIESVQG